MLLSETMKKPKKPHGTENIAQTYQDVVIRNEGHRGWMRAVWLSCGKK